MHFTELRTALTAVFTAAGKPAPSYDETIAVGGVIHAENVSTIRTAIVQLVNQAPTVSAPTSQSSVTGMPVSVAIVASDPDGNSLTYSATGLPSGLSINSSTGVVSGTLTASAGSYSVTATASDSLATGSRTFTWTVVEHVHGNLGASLTSPRVAGTSVTWTASATQGIAPYSYKFGVSSDGGANYSVVRDWSTTATYVWQPTQVNANYRIVVWVRSAVNGTDSYEDGVSQAFVITANQPPTVSAPGDLTSVDGMPVSVAIAASDPRARHWPTGPAACRPD